MRKKVDSRIRTLVENCHKLGQRSMFVIVGDKGRDQVVNLHYMLSKTAVKARPSVLWCYKKDLYLSWCARIKVLGKFSKVRTPMLAKPGADVLQPGVILDYTVSGLTMLQGNRAGAKEHLCSAVIARSACGRSRR